MFEEFSAKRMTVFAKVYIHTYIHMPRSASKRIHGKENQTGLREGEMPGHILRTDCPASWRQ